MAENKTFENFNPYTTDNTSKKVKLDENSIREKVREMIIKELGGEDYELETRKQMYGINPEIEPFDDEEEDYSDYFFDIDTPEEDLDEAKKKKDEEVEDVETTDIEATEEVPVEDTPIEEPTGGIENVAADMGGTESEVMDHLMSALKIAKGLNNNKLETQIANTLKFFVSEYIGGEE